MTIPAELQPNFCRISAEFPVWAPIVCKPHAAAAAILGADNHLFLQCVCDLLALVVMVAVAIVCSVVLGGQAVALLQQQPANSSQLAGTVHARLAQ